MAFFLFGFCVCIVLGAFFCWIWLPDVQEPRERSRQSALRHSSESGRARPLIEADERGGGAAGWTANEHDPASTTDDEMENESLLGSYKIPNKSLEEASAGWAEAVKGGQKLGFHTKTRLIWKRLAKRVT